MKQVFGRVVALTLVCATVLRAQVIRGTVVDASSRAPIAAATIDLFAERDSILLRATSDTGGAFSITLPRAGNFTIQAKRIGFLVARPTPFHVGPNETMTIEMRLDSRAVPLEPVAVTARGSDWESEFEQRRRTGAFGRFLTRKDIESQNAQETTSLFRTTPGVVIQRTRRGGSASQLLMRGTAGLCQPAVFIDNLLVPLNEQVTLDHMLTPPMIEGVEIYSSVAGAPTQYRIGTCGALVFWTRHGGSEGGRPLRWKEILIGAGVAGGLLVLILAR